MSWISLHKQIKYLKQQIKCLKENCCGEGGNSSPQIPFILSDTDAREGGNGHNVIQADTHQISVYEDELQFILDGNTAVLSLVPVVPPYKVYSALLSQSGTNAPVATILENTLGGTPVYTRTGPGEYSITLVGVFLINKTFCFTGPADFSTGSNNGSLPLYPIRVNNDVIAFDGRFDDVMDGMPFEIRIYN